MGVRTEETSTMRHMLCGASGYIIIPWVLFGIADCSTFGIGHSSWVMNDHSMILSWGN